MSNIFNIQTDDKTVLEYLKCYDYIDLDEIQILEKLFTMLKDNEVICGSYIKDGMICRGVKISHSKKIYRAINTLVLDNINFYNGDKEMYFRSSLSALASVLPYISPDDRVCLNTLFEGINKLDRGVDSIIEIDSTSYLPILNYKKSYLKEKKR